MILKLSLKIDKSDCFFEEKVFAPLISVELIENAFKHTDFLAQDYYISIQLELYIILYNEKQIEKQFLPAQNLLLISKKNWRGVIDSKSFGLSDIPSTFIISNP